MYFDLVKRLLIRTGVTVGFTFLLFQLGKLLPYSGDGAYAVELAESDWIMLMHSVLTTLVHKIFFVSLEPFGWEAIEAIMLSSSVAGAVALQSLFAIRRDTFFLLINIFSGSFLVFAGMVENYAWVNMCLIGSAYYLERYIDGRSPLYPAMSLFCLAALFHGLAFFYLPAYLFILYRFQRFHVFEFLIPFFLLIFLYLGLNTVFRSKGLDIDSSRLVPWFDINRKGQFFTLFSPPHLSILMYFHFRMAFMGIPLEIPSLILLRKRINTPFKQFLAVCSITGLTWMTFWHPDLGRLDWDLFSQPGIYIHLLLGLLASDRSRDSTSGMA